MSGKLEQEFQEAMRHNREFTEARASFERDTDAIEWVMDEVDRLRNAAAEAMLPKMRRGNVPLKTSQEAL